MKRVGELFRENLLSQVKNGVASRESTFVFSYTGVSSGQLNDLRKSLKKKKSDVYVSKKAIARLALKELKYDPLAERLNGQTAFVWSDEDSVEVSKTLLNFAKQYQGISIQGGVLNGAVLDGEDVKRLSELPSREVLLAQLLATMQAPLTRFAFILNSKSRDLLSILKQLSEKKGGS